MITRWRIPPESWCGYERRRLPVDADELEQLGRPARAPSRFEMLLVRAHHVDELVADPHHGVERVHRALEDHRDVAPAEVAELLLASCRRGPRRGRGCCRRRSWPGGRRICMIAFATVVLPQPDSPASPRISPARIARSMPSTARVAELPVAVLDLEPAELEQRLGARRRGLGRWDSTMSVFIVPEPAFAPGGRAPSAGCAAASRSAASGC